MQMRSNMKQKFVPNLGNPFFHKYYLALTKAFQEPGTQY